MQRSSTLRRNLDINKSNHPGVTLTLLLFKAIPVFLYFFSSMIFGSKIIGISFITILSGIDFWFTKNIAGRLMVGLLWEREILPNGEEQFTFECNADEQKNNKVDRFFFWWS